MAPRQKIYFSAGPAMLVQEVLDEAQKSLQDYQGLGLSVLEMSHRSKAYGDINSSAEKDLRQLLNVPDNYSVLFLQGGAKLQFEVVPMNLCQELNKFSADYIVSGSWSKSAAKAAGKYIKVNQHVLKSDKFDRIPTESESKGIAKEGSRYTYYCDNETIEGTEFNYVPETGNPESVLVSDMTSNFMTKPVDVSKFGVIFAGAQKNCGIAGLVIVIIRKDLLGKHMSITPDAQNYSMMEEQKSLLNTPPTFAVYMAGLYFKWMLKNGGLEAMDRLSKEKSSLIYEAIDNSDGFYTCPVEKSSRSRMNVVFLIAEKTLDDKFLERAQAANLYDLKGHRSVGGFRASIYHGASMEDVKVLVEFLNDFRQEYSH